jgi:ribulose-bisphosphate carboxylase small chain
MKLETFSYLPEFTDQEVETQIRAILDRGLVVALEYTDEPDPREHYWTLWKLPLFGISDPAVVLADLERCRVANPHSYIRLNGYDPVRQGQVMSFVVHRPTEGV